MNFISTRTSNETKSFEEVSLEGLASDGGLYIPISWKHFDNSKLIKELSFQKVAYNIIRQFVGNDINDKDLKCLVEKSYGKFRKKTSLL